MFKYISLEKFTKPPGLRDATGPRAPSGLSTGRGLEQRRAPDPTGQAGRRKDLLVIAPGEAVRERREDALGGASGCALASGVRSMAAARTVTATHASAGTRVR